MSSYQRKLPSDIWTEGQTDKQQSVHKTLHLWDTLMRYMDSLRDLVPFVQFKKREKHPWRSVTLTKFAGFSVEFY